MSTPGMRPTLILSLREAELRDLMQRLEQFGPAVRRKHLRIGLSAAGGVIKRDAQARARRLTGLLKKSLAVKVFVAPHSDKPSTVRIGINKGVFGVFRRTGRKLRRVAEATAMLRERMNKRGKDKDVLKKVDRQLLARKFSDTHIRRPVHYAHLVEHGHKKGKGKSAARPYPFLKPALEQSANAAVEALTRKLREGIAQEAAKRAAQ